MTGSIPVRETPRGRNAYKVWRSIGTRWADNDAYGHVNNIVYYGWFDTAVNAWLIDRGLLDVAGGGIVGLVVATNCSYFHSLSYPEEVSVGLVAEHIGRSSVRYGLGVFRNGSDAPAAQGGFTHVYVDRSSRRPTPLPEEWRIALKEISAPGGDHSGIA